MSDQEKKNKRTVKGIVVSAKMDKTVVVRVETKKPHPVYKKIMKSHKKYYAHDENNICKEGDEVIIEEYRPLSKLKNWVILTKID